MLGGGLPGVALAVYYLFRQDHTPEVRWTLLVVVLLVWLAAFLIPAGTYDRSETGVPEPGSYQRVDSPQDVGERVEDFFLAPVNGLYGLQDPETGFVRPFGVGSLFGAVGVFRRKWEIDL